MPEEAKRVSVAGAVRVRELLRGQTRTVGLCHGCFDILHAGHVHHLRRAASEVDVLFVSVTADEHVGKGPGRPIFTAESRASVLAALEMVDYVVVNDTATAADLLRRLTPDVYIKGADYSSGEDPRLAAERSVVEALGGRLVLTGNEVFDSSTRAFRELAAQEQSR